MKRCVIVGGAPIRDYHAICSYLRKDDFCIFCDSGLAHRDGLGIRPSLVVGDFDSHDVPDWSVEIIKLPCEKDDTDTVYAVKEAVSRGFDEFLLIGMVGARFDHSLGNIAILLYLDSLNIKAMLVDDYSEMEIVTKTPAYISDKFAFFSLLNISGMAKGISIENAKYLLYDGEISPQYQYGISNQVLPGKTAKVFVSEGAALLVKVRNN